jgi:hypothetical protein
MSGTQYKRIERLELTLQLFIAITLGVPTDATAEEKVAMQTTLLGLLTDMQKETLK